MTLQERMRRAQVAEIDGHRLTSRLQGLRVFGGQEDGGVTRQAFTPQDVSAREAVAGLMRSAGLEVRVDPASNLIGTAVGQDAGLGTLVLGSHLDSVPGGGGFDGAYGVIAAIEVLQALRDRHVSLRHSVAVVAFANEEGTPGTSPMFGSRAVAGLVAKDELDAPTEDGRPLAEVLDAAGGDSSRLHEASWPPDSVASFIEAHIEQGPVLERAGARIGVVEAISGRQTAEIVVRGNSGHGGTTPMELRHDALVAAAHAILDVRELAAPTGPIRVVTTGQCEVTPGAWNVIPGEARLRIDLRDVSGAAMDEALSQLDALTQRIAASTGTEITVSTLQRVPPVRCDERLRELAAEAARTMGYEPSFLPSGAGHDAQWMARIAPAGMIFVPSRDGRSHVPEEYTESGDLIAGADVLLHTLLLADRSMS